MDFLESFISIVLIDLVLSGDNAVVIGMAAHRLSGRQRRVAIIGGATAAIVLRIVLTAIASILLGIPLLKFAGGVLLLWIAFQLLKEEEERHEGSAPPDTFRAAIWTIIMADVVMSTDNVLGIAAAARGNTGMLLFGLLLSMPIIMIGGSLIARILDRFWWLAYVGSAVIAWTSVELMLTDPYVGSFWMRAGLVVEGHGHAGELAYEPTGLGHVVMLAVTVLTLALAHYFHRHRPAQRRMQRAAQGTEDRE
jgi:YjbE family integral membrane protein